MIKIRKMARLMCSAYVCFFALLLGFVLIGGLCYAVDDPATKDISGFNDFANTITAIMSGAIGKTLAMIAFIAAGISLMSGRYGVAIGCVMGGLFLAFAPAIAKALFK